MTWTIFRVVNCLGQENEKSIETKGSIKTTFRIEKQRYNWIDQARGFVMFFLVVTELMPDTWKHANVILWFFLDHPNDSTNAQYMDFYDIGVPAFFFIIGLLMAVSFMKRLETKGKGPAVANAVLRWAMVGVVGILFIVIPAILGGQSPDTWFGEVKEIAPGVSWYVVYWDVVPALGFVGLASIPFLFIPRRERLLVSFAMMTFYQIMTFIPQTYWRDYAAASVHGGIIGGIFVMIPITLIASVIGEFFILDKTTAARDKAKNLLLLGIVNAAIGFGLWIIPGGYPSKRQSTMSWATISIAVCIFISYLLLRIDYKDEDFQKMNPVNKGRIVLFKAYGMNPFLIYALVVIPDVVIRAVANMLGLLTGNEFWIQLGEWLIIVPVITLIALLLLHANKAISTTKVAFGVIVVVIGLTLALLPILL